VFLKYIEIQGFKSFPDKTRLNFDRVLTSIVGPNGSGKSNLSDAVRWVLGEQSSKSLRGGKMEDVIFGGTKLRKPMGFAQVSLCLDNSDGKIADVGKEIVVTRRYYRSGDSEYAVNGATVRLRDLREMFMDTGLGRDGYSIIGQGRIAEVVESKPLDRREVFEEASGIAKYRFRKTEAERKLTAAEDNLSRLRDITGELESRLGPLAEQSRKAKLFLTLAEERKKLEISLYCDTIRRSQENLHAQDEKIEIARLDYAGIEQKLAQQNEEIEALYEQNRLSNAEADAISTAITEKTDAIAALEAKIAVVKNDIMHAERNLRALEDDKGALSEDGSAVLAEINARRLEAEQKKAEADELTAVIDGLQQELQDLIENSEATDLRRAETAKKLTAVQNEISELRVLAASAQSVLQTLAEREQTIHTALPAEQKRHDECAAEHAAAQKYAEQLSRDSAAKENEANGYALKLQSRTEKREAIAARLASADAEAERMRSRIAALGEIERNMEGFMPPVRKVMQAKERRELGGIIGTVGSLLEVKSGLEIAVETALGAAMQNIVVENERAAKQGIAYLKETKAGRATFLPLDSIKPSRFDFADRLNDDGVIGLASELVSCDAAYKKVADYLLGRIIVAEDLDYASALARRIGYRCRIVTRDGQQINAGGSYMGGFSSRQGGSFSRRSEIEALQQKLQQMQKDTEKDREAEAALAGEIALLSAQHTAVLSELTTAREDSIRAEAQLERYAREMQAIEHNRAVADEELARIAATRSEKQTEIARSEGRANALVSDVQRLERALTAEDSADGFMQRRAELMESISARRITRAELIKDAERLDEAAAQLQQQSADALDRTANLEAAMQAIREQMQTMQATVDADTEAAAALRAEIEVMRGEIAAKSEQRALNEAAIKRIRTEQDSETEQRERIASEISRLEERKTALEADYNNFLTRLWDEYELTLAEAAPLCVAFSSVSELRQQVASVRGKIRALGSVNVDAIEEYEEVSARYEFLNTQIADVENSRKQLLDLIGQLEGEMKQIFTVSFNEINTRFHRTFTQLFGGGNANLYLSDENDILGSGIELDVQPPGKVIKNLSALSGGEKALVAIAIYMAILEVNPSPFCILDEIDSALDESNVVRFAQYLGHLIEDTQIIAITHRRGTMEAAEVLYGVTMQEDGVSKVLRLGVEEARLVIEGERNNKQA